MFCIFDDFSDFLEFLKMLVIATVATIVVIGGLGAIIIVCTPDVVSEKTFTITSGKARYFNAEMKACVF